MLDAHGVSLFVVKDVVDFIPVVVVVFKGQGGIIAGIKQYGMVDVLGHLYGFLYTPPVIGAIVDVKT